MTSPACLACGHGTLRPVRPYRTESPAGKALFGRGLVMQCAACGQPQYAPLPSDDELSRYYATDYRKGGRHGADAADLSAFPMDNLFFYNRGVSVTELLKPRLEGRAGPLRFLDVGAGFGHILHMLGQAFPTATRIAHEMSEPCVAHLRRTGVTVLQGDLASALEGQAPFDAIVMSHVLEHVRDPVAMLAMLRGHLAPGGWLYVEVPHVSPDALTRYSDNPWAPRHDEPHLTFFGGPQLRAVLERAGLQVAFLETAGPAWREVSALRYRLPQLMPVVRRLVPRPLLRQLQRQPGVQRATLPQRAPDFYAYGGYRIWLRSISQARPAGR